MTLNTFILFFGLLAAVTVWESPSRYFYGRIAFVLLTFATCVYILIKSFLQQGV